MVRKGIILLMLLVGAAISTDAETIRNPQFTADPDVRTVTLRCPGELMVPPVVRLDTEDRLELNFDILGESNEYLRCRLVNCDADWQPSLLTPGEYTDGFNEVEITDYALSSNTYQHYVNYNMEIPAEGMRPLKGGNYLLQVYREDSPDEVILQTGFYVTGTSLPVTSSVTSRTDRGFNTQFQQLEISLDIADDHVRNPYDDLKIVVVQNNRPETARIITHPTRVEGSRVIYSHLPELIFPAGKEYRRFETVRADYPGMHVDSVGMADGKWHAWLTPDEPRKAGDYDYDRTQHGRFVVDEYNAGDPNLGADYVMTHFRLGTDEIPGAEIYVDGEFSMNRHEDFNRMRYNPSDGWYEADILLKQGSYNYQYVKKNGDGTISPSPIEGDSYETDNEYLILVYHRPPGSRADELLAWLTLTSRE